MAIVIISCAICSVLCGSLGFLLGAICTMASDKNQQPEGLEKSSLKSAQSHYREHRYLQRPTPLTNC
jgi:hypothetical protein